MSKIDIHLMANIIQLTSHFIQKMHGKQHNILRVSELMDWAAQQYGFKEIGTAEVRYSTGSL